MGYLYTTIQFILLGLIFFTPPLIPDTLPALVILGVAVLLGLWAIWVFRHTRINIFPYLPKGAQIIQAGPYKYVRHPMYTAVMFFGLAYFVAQSNWYYIAYFFMLLFIVILKIRFEERQLIKYADEYEKKFFSTYRLFPCVY